MSGVVSGIGTDPEESAAVIRPTSPAYVLGTASLSEGDGGGQRRATGGEQGQVRGGQKGETWSGERSPAGREYIYFPLQGVPPKL